MRKGFAAALAVVGVATFAALSGPATGSSFLQVDDATADMMFINYIGQYQKQYSTKEEFLYRMKVFMDNAAMIEAHNSQNSASYQLGINKFSDMTPEELEVRLGLKGNRATSKMARSGENSFIIFNTTDLPKSVDWRPTGAVTKVLDQGSCGSCYAISAVGAIEGAYWNVTRKTTELSVQQIVECADGDY